MSNKCSWSQICNSSDWVVDFHRGNIWPDRDAPPTWEIATAIWSDSFGLWRLADQDGCDYGWMTDEEMNKTNTTMEA